MGTHLIVENKGVNRLYMLWTKGHMLIGGANLLTNQGLKGCQEIVSG